MNFWDQIRNYLQQKVSAEGYDNWLKGTAFVGHGRRHAVSSPCPTGRPAPGWKPSMPACSQPAFEELGLPVRQCQLRDRRPRTAPQARRRWSINGSARRRLRVGSLNPKFTFDSFVVGACNQFAHAAAQVGGHQPLPQLQPAVPVRRGGYGQDPPDARHRARADRPASARCASSTPRASAS